MYRVLPLQPIHHTFDSFLHQDNIPIEKEPHAQISQPHIRQQLRFIKRQHLLDSLVFNCHHLFDKDVNPVSGVKALAIVDDRDDYLRLHCEPALSKFMRMAFLIR